MKKIYITSEFVHEGVLCIKMVDCPVQKGGIFMGVCRGLQLGGEP